jgi:hypothetical protein
LIFNLEQNTIKIEKMNIDIDSDNDEITIYYTYKNINLDNSIIEAISQISCNKPIDETIRYSYRKIKKTDIPYLKIYRSFSYNPMAMTGNRIYDIKYFHSKGLILDFRPELGALQENSLIERDKISNIYNFESDLDRTLKHQYFDNIINTKTLLIEDTSCYFSQLIMSSYRLLSLEYIKISCKPIVLEEYKEQGLFEEHPSKMYGAIYKKGLTQDYTAQPIIIAFSSSKDNLQILKIENTDFKYPDDCVIQEVLIIGWLGEMKENHKFYGIQNKYCCEGILYTDNIDKYRNSNGKYNISINEIKMNEIYEDGILNS